MKEIPKIYQADKFEDEIYELWEKSGFFSPDKIAAKGGSANGGKSIKKYSNILPPPNANGELHLGHVSGYTVMDIFARWRRMKGEKVLLLPGKDHAGILTQVVYEKKLKGERGVTRQDLGRKKFYEEAYDFCMDRANYMRAQEKKIGISADWSREKFTLDPDVLKIALETFVKMHKDGMIYRGKRIINWCPRCATALSDLEVVHEEIDGKLYHIKYPLKDNSENFITVATTRPETMLGDTAVAVNPKDARYKGLVGKDVILPLVNREIPIVADRRVETEFGTGAVKVTPAHDALDWKIGEDHELPVIQVINEEAKITEKGGKYAGQKISEARKNIVKDLENLGFLEKIEDAKVGISICERCKCVIEPLVSRQWFIDVDAKKYSLKKESLKAIKSGEIRIYPESFKKILVQWFSNLEDWCVSRQIWWGPRIPVWYKTDRANPDANVYVGLSVPKGDGWAQEEDTFDTWFTSGQWAYSTLGFPKGKDYKDFYPTDMMIMGRDILFFWAARMIMLSLYRTGKAPFKNLYFTGLIRDEKGQKMSKSKGNGIDPLEMIEKYGADALRLSLIMDTTPGQDSRLFEKKIEGYRNYVTKLWNIYRYSATAFADFKSEEKISKKEIRTLADRWIISRLQRTISQADKFLEARNVSLAQEKIRKFIWEDLADWYLEISKIEKNKHVLGYVLGRVLRLSHPFMPFVTEKIYRDLSGGKKMLMISEWPKTEKELVDNKSENEFGKLQDAVGKIRHLRASYKIDPARVVKAYGKNIKNREIIEKLARIEIVSEKISGKVVQAADLELDIAELVDVEKERARLKEEILNLENLIKKNEILFANKKFVESAPEKVILQNKAKLEEYKEKIEDQKELLKNLE